MCHYSHLIAQRRESKINRNPIRVCEWQRTGVADIDRRATLGDHHHPERTCLPTKSRTVVVSPERRWRQVGMQLSCDFPLREGVLIHSARSGDHDSSAGPGQRWLQRHISENFVSLSCSSLASYFIAG